MVQVSGGTKLAGALKRLSSQVTKAATVDVGFPEGATEPGGQSSAFIAAIQEYGAPKAGIPPRPFFRSMIQQHAEEWPDEIAILLKSSDYDAAVALDILGQRIAGELADSIIELMEPALSPVTVMLRGMRRNDPSLVVTGKTVAAARARVMAGKTNYGASTKPLVDSGTMLSNIKSIVR